MERSLLAFHMNAMSPFLDHPDCHNDRLAEAHALLLVLADAVREGESGKFNACNPDIKGRCIDGIATLVAMAKYHSDMGGAEQRSRPAAVA